MDTRGPRPEPRITPAHTPETAASSAHQLRNPGFTPSSADQDFCSAVSVINSRPQPRDEFVEVVVADQYLAAIERYVPIDLRDEFDVVLEFTRSVVEAGSFDEDLSNPDRSRV